MLFVYLSLPICYLKITFWKNIIERNNWKYTYNSLSRNVSANSSVFYFCLCYIMKLLDLYVLLGEYQAIRISEKKKKNKKIKTFYWIYCLTRFFTMNSFLWYIHVAIRLKTNEIIIFIYLLNVNWCISYIYVLLLVERINPFFTLNLFLW